MLEYHPYRSAISFGGGFVVDTNVFRYVLEVVDFYAIMGDLYHIKKMNVEAYAAYDSALVYKENNIGALRCV